jgi:hypothetical protein
MTIEGQPQQISPDDEQRIRQAVRQAVSSCRLCGDGSDCIGNLVDLFRYFPPEVRQIVEDEQSQVLQGLVGGD